MSQHDNAGAAGPGSGRTFFGHPVGLGTLFFTEMWERFSYYGMRALLIFYLTWHFLFESSFSLTLYGAYVALVYLGPLLGGWLADKYIGFRKAVTFGAILLVAGHGLMGLHGPAADETLTVDGTVYQLERRLDARGPGAGQALLQARRWQGFDDLLDEWLDETARSLAYAAVVLVSVLDLPVVVVDGSFPASIGAALVQRMRQQLAGMDMRGIHAPEIVSGSLSTMACALGAGYQPIVARYLLD